MFEKCIYFNSNAFVRQINRIWDDAFKPLGLSPSHAYVLRLVLQQPGIGMKDIAEALELAPSTVTRFVDSLINRQLLEKKLSEGDKRGMRVFPTAEAKKIQQALEDTGKLLYERMNLAIGEDVFDGLVSELRRTRQNL